MKREINNSGVKRENGGFSMMRENSKTNNRGINMETEKSEKTESINTQTDVKTSRHAVRYLIVGILVTGFNYALFAILSNLIIKNNNLIWLSN